MTRRRYRYECDDDLIHDQVDGVTDVNDLTPEQAVLAGILGWPVTACRSGPRARLTPGQRDLVAELLAWKHRPAVPAPHPPGDST